MNNQVFHQGEIEIQERLGVKDRLNSIAKKVIRDHMPDQHRAFYEQLPYIFCGYQDEKGQLWASVLWLEKGFISSRNSKHLSIHGGQIVADPIYQTLQQQKAVALLGIDLSNRRRNRLSAVIEYCDNNSMTLKVRQSFGNCPKYIQRRSFDGVKHGPGRSVIQTSKLSPEMVNIILKSDTFFVSSASHMDSENNADGVDISHRGGKQGFVFIESNNSLLIPDFPGNNYFNTLGNFSVNPNAGLLFIDFENGHILQLSGKAEILWSHRLLPHFENAQRFWRFKITRTRLLPKRLDGTNVAIDTSPYSQTSGTWETALKQAKKNKAFTYYCY